MGRSNSSLLNDYDRSKGLFFDMVHSNNAARIRLWLGLTPNSSDFCVTKIIQYADLRLKEYSEINPMRKCPAFIRPDGQCVFESSIILDYLEDKYGDGSFTPDTPEERQEMNLLIRLHDLYVASPNNSQPGFSHTQGSMYLTPRPTAATPAARCMPDPAVRAKKIAELYKQLNYLDRHIRLPYIMGDQLTLVDMTWFPTAVFCEYMLPKVFGWKNIFSEASNHLARLANWFHYVQERHPSFARVHADIYGHWEQHDAEGHFDTIRQVVEKEVNYQWVYPVNWQASTPVLLNYQEPPPEGFRTGRYIDQPDRGGLVDERIATRVTMQSARSTQTSLTEQGFCLAVHPTALDGGEFLTPSKVKDIYYQEMQDLIQKQTGCKSVYIFDHTLRNSQQSGASANAKDEKSEVAPVPRVHSDYTAEGAPNRLKQLVESNEIVVDGQKLEASDVDGMRFAFINIWRSIDPQNPVMEQPLAILDARTVKEEDRFLYELHFPHRVGQNYSLRVNPDHQWYYYPKMTFDECLIFKVFDTVEPRFVFHTAFTDPRGGFATPARRSIEVRSIAFF